MVFCLIQKALADVQLKATTFLFLNTSLPQRGLISQHLMEPDTQHPISATCIGKGAESHSSSWEVL